MDKKDTLFKIFTYFLSFILIGYAVLAAGGFLFGESLGGPLTISSQDIKYLLNNVVFPALLGGAGLLYVQIRQQFMRKPQEDKLNAPSDDTHSSTSRVEIISMPIFITIISWGMLLGGILKIAEAVRQLSGDIVVGIFNVIMGSAWIFTGYGLRKLKRWSLVAYIIITILLFIFTMIATILKSDAKALLIYTPFLVIGMIVLAYLLKMKEKFTS